jgi:probable addiction module antidote protein
MSKIKTRPWDSVEHLRDETDIRHYIDAALEEAPDDTAFLAMVLGDVARARNIAELARTTGIARETLYKTLRGEGNPTMSTISKLANALGFRISLTPLNGRSKPKSSPRKAA